MTKDKFTPIDRENWPREEIYRVYTELWTTTLFSVTVRIDVTETVRETKRRGEKFVPAVLYLFSRELSRQENFTLAVRDGILGCWERLHPLYPVLNETGNFTFHTTPYYGGYRQFYRAYIAEQERNGASLAAFAEPAPENNFIISIMPYLKFEGFSFSLKNAKNYYTPTVSVGKYYEENGRLYMPVSVTVNHAASDANHLNILFSGVEAAMQSPLSWIEEENE